MLWYRLRWWHGCHFLGSLSQPYAIHWGSVGDPCSRAPNSTVWEAWQGGGHQQLCVKVQTVTFKTDIVAFLSRKLRADTQDHTSWNDNPGTASQEAPASAYKGTIGEIPVSTEQLIQRLSLADSSLLCVMKNKYYYGWFVLQLFKLFFLARI